MKNFLKHPLAANLDLDSPDAPSVHRQIIRSKPFLQKLYYEWHQAILSHLPDHPGKKILELGSGGGCLQEVIPDIITSDVQRNRNVNVSIIIDGRCLPFSASSLDAIVMIDVFHHLHDVNRFLEESVRCLAAKGKIVMVEPCITAWSAVIYKYLHHEPFCLNARNGIFPIQGHCLVPIWRCRGLSSNGIVRCFLTGILHLP